MKRYILGLGWAAAVAMAAPAAQAQQAPDPDVAGKAGANAIAEVVVTANRAATAADKVGSSVTVLTEQMIKASQATNAVELLAQTPGVSFVRNGGPGAATSLNIRGSENQHTVVLIDGVKLNDPSSTQGGFNIGNLMIGDISRIEVLRGAQSTLWGSQAIGGVVNIVTDEPQKPFESSLDAEGGSRGTAYVRGGVGGASDRLVWRAAAGYYTTDGFSAYKFGHEDDGYKNTGVSGRLRYNVTDDVSVELRSVYSKGRNDFDGIAADSAEYGHTDELVVYAGLNFSLLDGRLKNRIGFAYTDTDRQNFNPILTTQPLTFDAAGKNERWEYQGTFAIREGWTATFGAETENARMRTRSPTTGEPDPAFDTGKAGIDSVYGQIQGEVIKGLTLTAGLRHDDQDTYGGRTLGQVAGAWSLNGGNTVLRASWGQGFRAPGLFELYSEFGNLKLDPEKFESWDAGVEQRLFDGRVRLSATWFDRDADNEIRFNSCDFGSTDPLCTVNGTERFGYYRNVLKTRAQGLELEGEAKPTDRLTLSGNYTYTDAETASGPNDGKQLTRRPKNMWNLAGTYRWPVDLSTTVAVRHVGRTFNDDANTVVVAGYTLVDLRVSYPLTQHLEVFGRIENALDKDYQTILNYGAPRRGFFAGVRARF
jgi:vitamin B12 transporter